ncbi:MAG: acyl-CoA dehydrogenase, partial [Plesiomonas shigelloides]
MTLILIVLSLILLGALAYHRIPLLLSSRVCLGSALLCALLAPETLWLWIPVLIVVLPLNFLSLRKKWISAPILRTFRHIMPAMSRTEKEAIEA